MINTNKVRHEVALARRDVETKTAILDTLISLIAQYEKLEMQGDKGNREKLESSIEALAREV